MFLIIKNMSNIQGVAFEKRHVLILQSETLGCSTIHPEQKFLMRSSCMMESADVKKI